VEYAGNGRVFLSPRSQAPNGSSAPWAMPEWTGVPLALVLKRAGLTGDVSEIGWEGADCGIAAE
jgi:DMSO/TMAO reductase YedYZ molybdopterin-dependent catalytic subunit